MTEDQRSQATENPLKEITTHESLQLLLSNQPTGYYSVECMCDDGAGTEEAVLMTSVGHGPIIYLLCHQN